MLDPEPNKFWTGSQKQHKFQGREGKGELQQHRRQLDFCNLWALEEATGEQQECAGWVETVPDDSED